MAEEEERWGEERVGEVKQALLYATMELESTRLAAQGQIQRMECDLARLRDLLCAATRERDEAREQARHALLLLHSGGIAANESLLVNVDQHAAAARFLPPEFTHAGAGFLLSPSSSSLSSDDSSLAVSSTQARPPAGEVELYELVPAGRLPEKGRLLEAVMSAGPLLHNVMLAGPLPQWQHPPPPLGSLEIPPFSVSTNAMTMPGEDSKSRLGHPQGLCNRRKRDLEGEESMMMPSLSEVCGQSPTSSSSFSPRTGSRGKHPKTGPFLFH